MPDEDKEKKETYVVTELGPLRHSKETYNEGDEVELTERQAKPLLETGIVSKSGKLPEVETEDPPQKRTMQKLKTKPIETAETGSPDTPIPPSSPTK